MDQRGSRREIFSRTFLWVGGSLVGMVIGVLVASYIFFSLDVSARTTDTIKPEMAPSTESEVVEKLAPQQDDEAIEVITQEETAIKVFEEEDTVAESVIDPQPEVEVVEAQENIEAETIEVEPQAADVESEVEVTEIETAEKPPIEKAQVVAVIDGDTIDVVIDGVQHRVHYILTDIPEDVPGLDRLTAGATEFNKYLVEGKTILMQTDVVDTDENGDLLRYVFVGEDLLMVNLLLINHGFAQVDEDSPNTAYRAQLEAMQRQAQELKRGIWYNYKKPDKNLSQDGTI